MTLFSLFDLGGRLAESRMLRQAQHERKILMPLMPFALSLSKGSLTAH
jgi:hypothetical protein